ncbi:Otoancorin [Liparis tanakae]|uniref:Otoancorin n=1 Tax=Liparis tanakae TaxID=230148 RepID=A0A4Z2ICF3_9TELE|nr:Otoancorin [Liparis tanakae]
MSLDVLTFSLEQMASCQHIPQRHRAELIQLVKSTFGDSSSWSAETMEALGPFVLMDDNSTSALPNKVCIFGDITCHLNSDAAHSDAHFYQDITQNQEGSWMKDVLYSLTSGRQYTSNALRKKIFHLTTSSNAATRSADQELSVELIEELGMNNVYWTHTQLAGMSDETFLASLETLGAVGDYGDDQLAELSKKAIELLGPVSQMTESEVMQLGCITQGFSDADLEKLPISRDTLEDINICGWKTSQVKKTICCHSNIFTSLADCGSVVSRSVFQPGGWRFNPRLVDVSSSKTPNPALFPVDVLRCMN